MQIRDETSGTLLATDAAQATGLWPRFRGLMLKSRLGPGEGLVIKPCGSIHMMFMRFPIDAVFLGRPDPAHGGARPVVSVHRGLRAWIGLVPLVRGAHGVLELPVGTIEVTGTVPGDHVLFET